MHMNIGTLALCSTLHQSAHLKIPQMPLSESEITCRDGNGRGSFQRALHLQYCMYIRSCSGSSSPAGNSLFESNERYIVSS